MRASRRLAALAAVGAALAVGWPASVAAAANRSISIDLGHGWVHDSATPLFDFDRIAPGWTGERTLRVRNDGSGVATLALSAGDIVEAENGCNHPESVVDTSCGGDQGELGHQLQLTVYTDPDGDGVFDTTPAWTGGLYDLRRAAVLAGDVGAHAVTGVRLDATLPDASGNETQTDQVGFDVRLSLEGDTSSGTVEVKGTRTTRSPQHGLLGGVTGMLPLTGSPTGRLLAGSLWLLLAGGALALLGRARRRSTN
jgi:hypothetical protein